MVLQLIDIELCGSRIESTPGGSEYSVPEDCRIVAFATMSSLERALSMVLHDSDFVKDLVDEYEREGRVERCTEHMCVRIRPIFVVL